MVGSAIENAATALVDGQRPLMKEARYATDVDFGKVFAAVEQDDEEGSQLADVLDVLHQRWADARTFQASEVAGFINGPMQDEADSASVLRGFFDAGGRRGASSITPVTVGRRLAAVAGAPVFVGDQIMRLERSTPGKSGARKTGTMFRVHLL